MTLDWQAEGLRLTAFLAPSAQPKGDAWWEYVTGNPPDTHTSKPALGQLVDVGPFNDKTLTLSIQAGRIDWLLSPSQDVVQDSSIVLKTVGSFPGVLDGYVQMMQEWLGKCPGVLRLAFGTTLLAPIESKPSGYQRLGRILPAVRLDPTGSEDFFYQINRPRIASGSFGSLKINRLSRWSVASLQRFSSSVALGSPTAPQLQISSKIMACRLELDMSTPNDRVEELQHKALPDIFRRLTVMGTEIAAKGDAA
jgi:hypothetical protein